MPDPNTSGEETITPEGSPEEVGPYPPAATSEWSFVAAVLIAAAALAALAYFRLPMAPALRIFVAGGILVVGIVFATGGLS